MSRLQPVLLPKLYELPCRATARRVAAGHLISNPILTTITIDGKKILEFAKDEDLLFNSLAQFMNKMPSQVVGGKSIKEWFRLRDHSLWWFAHNALAPRIDEQIRFIITFENILDTIQPEVIDVQGCCDKADLIKQICRKKNVRLSTRLYFKILLESMKQSIKNAAVKRASSIIAAQKRSKRIALAKEVKHESVENIRKGCIIHVAHETYRRMIYDFETGEVKEGEYIAQKILQQIKRKGVDLLGIDADHTSMGELRALQQRLNDEDQYWLPFEIITDMDTDRKSQKTADGVKQALATLFKNKEFQAMFNYKGIDLWHSLSIRFDLLEKRLPQIVKNIEAVKVLLQKLEPKSIFLLYEKGPSAMTFIVAADELGIKTVGMQHGMIYEWHTDYAINELRSGSSILGSPIPTITIVFGEYYKKLLTEKLAYPSDRVVVAGNPTYECLGIHSNQLDNKAVLSKLGLDPDKKTILVASSMGQKKYGQPDYDVVLMQTLVKSFANHKGIQVVMKLHPKEDGEIYKRIMDESNAANFSIISHPIEELMLVCDAFIAIATTTIMEAIVLEKPVIIVKPFDKANSFVLSLIENGAAIGTNYDELAGTLLDMLDNGNPANRLRTDFAKLHFNLPNRNISQGIADMLIDPDKNILKKTITQT